VHPTSTEQEAGWAPQLVHCPCSE